MFLNKDELKNVAYSYQLNEIAENDDTLLTEAIAIGIEEVRSYFTPNFKKEWGDGRFTYDVDAIFTAVDADRNPLILQHVKIAALWHLLILSNVDMIYDHIKERYDRTIDWLKRFAAGNVTLSDLPRKEISYEDEDGNPISPEPFNFGSRRKFHHE